MKLDARVVQLQARIDVHALHDRVKLAVQGSLVQAHVFATLREVRRCFAAHQFAIVTLAQQEQFSIRFTTIKQFKFQI